MRTIVDIPEEQLSRLKEICDSEKRSRASLIREAVREYVARKSTGAADDAFGIWKHRKTDTLEYEDRLRREWEQ